MKNIPRRKMTRNDELGCLFVNLEIILHITFKFFWTLKAYGFLSQYSVQIFEKSFFKDLKKIHASFISFTIVYDNLSINLGEKSLYYNLVEKHFSIKFINEVTFCLLFMIIGVQIEQLST